MSNFPLAPQSLMFAPMEGITDDTYRKVVGRIYPEWDTYSCDFLRVPNPNPYPLKHVRKHFGVDFPQDLKAKSIYQILTSPGAYLEETVEQVKSLGFHWIDLNLGCPSKTVCKHRGGSYLLSELPELKKIILTIRNTFPGVFTCKIRVGYKDDHNFEDIIRLIQDCGADAVVIHARTRDELYKGVAKWDYIKQATKVATIPVVGNGDIWTTEDIERYYDYTGCHSIMLARPALKTPWMARLVKNKEQDSPELRVKEICRYFMEFYKETESQGIEEASRIRRLKSVSRYIFEGLPNEAAHKKSFLLSKTFEDQMSVLEKLKIEVGLPIREDPSPISIDKKQSLQISHP